ncbi:hypothetical protein T492DRAFT_842195 [Pavlovales sp. CCMP2436]|nr:hypothetical protein T492DRAFT_842195 [Pavlovales sp. CCMP2436]
MVLPLSPVRVDVSEHAAFISEASGMKLALAAEKARRDTLQAAGREIQDSLALYLHERQLGAEADALARLGDAARKCAAQLQLLDARSELRVYVFTHAAQTLATAQCFESFLATGTLGKRPLPMADWTPQPPSADGPSAAEGAQQELRFLDSEWLHAMISAAHEIGRYAGRRAAAGDVASVAQAAAVVAALQEGMQQFNLRNGPLRQAYDSLKYVVRRLEDTLYELSLVSDAAAAAASAVRPPVASLVDSVLAKNAIFALHRADDSRAAEQLANATASAAEMIEGLVASQPSLRWAAFMRGMHTRNSNKGGGAPQGNSLTKKKKEEEEEVGNDDNINSTNKNKYINHNNYYYYHKEVEELVEAILFQRWLGARTIPTLADAAFAKLGLDAGEYLGGVGDLVGEIGRVAVARATARDLPTVFLEFLYSAMNKNKNNF